MQKSVPLDSVLIPEAARAVYTGVLFEVYQWEQELFDGTTKTFEMLRRPDSVDVIVVRGGQILVTTEEQPARGVSVGFPSGRVEAGEPWEEAAKRELLEETGLVCSSWKLIDVRQPVHKLEWFIGVYVASEVTSEQAQQLDGGEKIQLVWREYAELREAVIRGDEKGLARDYLSLFLQARTTDDLLGLPEFSGREVDR